MTHTPGPVGDVLLDECVATSGFLGIGVVAPPPRPSAREAGCKTFQRSGGIRCAAFVCPEVTVCLTASPASSTSAEGGGLSHRPIRRGRRDSCCIFFSF